jgi:hypothetical protein
VKSLLGSMERITELQHECEAECAKGDELNQLLKKTQDGLDKKLDRIEKKRQKNVYE